MNPVLHILAFGFLSPLIMAAGGLATSIPIVIHLLNKRKFRIVIWAAMEWLLAAQRRNARRLRFHRWLLLAIRCLAILFIAAGIAEMVLQNAAIGALVSRQHAVVILWDDSYSMGAQQDGAGGGVGITPFDRSKKLIADYVDHMPAGDSVLVIRTSTGGPAAAAGLKPSTDHQLVATQVNAATLTDAGTDLPGAFDRARLVLIDLEATARTRELILITDFSNSSIHDPHRGTTPGTGGTDNGIEGATGDRLKQAAKGAIAHATDFRMIDLGQEGQTNTAVTGLQTKRPIVVAGMPTDVTLEVFNGSDKTLVDQSVSILVDGSPAVTARIPRIQPASFQTADVTLNIPSPGRHLVEARLPGDRLPTDDTRRLMLNVRKEIPIQLFDGSPGDGGRTSYGSTFYLFAAYSLQTAGKPAGTFIPRITTELETPLSNYDFVILSDIAEPSAQTRETLQKYVAGGGTLMIFPGPRTDARRMNESLGENGAKLLPASLGQLMQPVGADNQPEGRPFDAEGFVKNPVLQVFASDYKAGKEVGLLTVQTTQYYKLGVPTDGSTEVILRYSDKAATTTPAATSSAQEDAAVVLRRGVGADAAHGMPGGTVVLFASTADMTWNTWGAKASFLPFIHELTFYALSRSTLSAGAGMTLEVGQSVNLPGDAAPGGSWNGPRQEQFIVTAGPKDGRTMLTSPPLKYAGVYGPATGDQRAVVAVNPDTREADIRHVPNEQMAAALGADVKSIVANPLTLSANVTIADNAGTSLGVWLVLIALGLFSLETFLALIFSTYR